MHTTPASTYRLQLSAAFTFDDAAARVPYLASLGVTHLFCSPILQAAPGSMHGYDVVDHAHVSADLGGEEGFRRLATAAHEHGLGIVVDVVPNHMSVPTPLWHNHALWDVLRRGADSEHARWFDMDLSGDQAILMPVLGERIGKELAQGRITVESREVPTPDGPAEQPVVCYFDNVFPVRPGTEDLPVAELLEHQWYRLAHWRVASEELNYRRFFDVDTLAALRVEDPVVFAATHATLLRLHDAGLIQGFRIDHIDGLANPRGYVEALHEATGGAWIVAEKILEHDEVLPERFACAGTTGYDALLRVTGLFQDTAALPRLTDLWEHAADSAQGFHSALVEAKQEVVGSMLFTEVNRLTSIVVGICDGDIRLRDHTRRQILHAITALLIAMDRYRAYVEPGRAADPADRQVLLDAAERAKTHIDDDEQDTLDLVVALAMGEPGTGDEGHGPETLPIPQADEVTTELPDAGAGTEALRAEFMIRFAQTCGPVMAKSKEDTAFYRWNRFIGVNEVGTEPTVVGLSPDLFHDFCELQTKQWPEAMTTLSTHDTKRSEDVRARLSAITEYPREWETCVAELRAATADDASELVDGATELFLWQTLAAEWRLPGTHAGRAPIDQDRLAAYLTKAMREAKTHTQWTEPDEAYEEAVQSLAAAALHAPAAAEALDRFTETTAASVRATILGQKLLQLTMPGVPDVYQGTEVVDLSLVDPDNRRPIDFYRLSGVLTSVDDGSVPDLDAEKLLVVSRALRLRREHPDAFRGASAGYRPVATTTGHAVAFERTDGDRLVAVPVATRLPARLAERDGWGEHTLFLPEGRFLDVLTGRHHDGGQTALADVLGALPVALLVPEDPDEG
ncbi:malto-oligosyltrehalose synthase [uncultured Tessaracoccus sp.]|uniref:malto-oligosyltrehalose synthase n=1 Tax=uncultured Tessaracoccus sp. TaxID=905023 RepID=UPI0025FFB842|nr:malto-oligosyltrehalose synthase [uncultured Tessaracoccus sp.]